MAETLINQGRSLNCSRQEYRNILAMVCSRTVLLGHSLVSDGQTPSPNSRKPTTHNRSFWQVLESVVIRAMKIASSYQVTVQEMKRQAMRWVPTCSPLTFHSHRGRGGGVLAEMVGWAASFVLRRMLAQAASPHGHVHLLLCCSFSTWFSRAQPQWEHY